MKLSCIVDMTPVPKARARITEHGAYTPEATVIAEGQIKLAWRQQNSGRRFSVDAALQMTVTAVLARPKRAPRRQYPNVRPDADNYLKLVSDALNEEAYADDGQIVDARCIKRYVQQGEVPHIVIDISHVA